MPSTKLVRKYINVLSLCKRTIRLRRVGFLGVLAALISCNTLQGSKDSKPAYLNARLPVDQRVNDLVGRMTLQEKVDQMLNQAPAIERLGIPEYNWWSEGLHGVARAGLATVFPQAIGLSATWDEDLMFEVADAISDEARAKHHAFAAQGKRFIYQGLTLWSPNINLFRDPRWGRGQETYGEDPYLTGRMAVQFIKGLQGDDERYLKTVATVKHFAVHSGPEPERHEFDAITNQRELYDTYLPQFETAIKEGGAQSLMCAYNRYNGKAACASHQLLDEILRKNWGFEGFVVSDCGAIEDLHLHHKVTRTPEESAAISVKAGTDLNCGKVYSSLVEAVEQGLIDEASIDRAVKRLFTARMKLGMFDESKDVPYANIPYSTVDSAEHKQLALDAARKSLVLLKNDNQTLPLSKDLQSIAVIGPNSDQWLMLLGNYNGVPSDPITPLRGIKEKLPNTQILFAQGSDLADGMPMLNPIPAEVLTHDQQPGLLAQFYGNSKLEGEPVYQEINANVDVNWSDKAPRSDLNDDDFSVRWSGQLTPKRTGNYQLGVISTCNTNVYLNGQKVVSTPYHFRDEYGDPRTKKSEWIALDANQTYQLEITAAETYADAQVQLVWAQPPTDLLENALSVVKKADAVVMFMGLTPRLEGEEMDVQVDGFRGGDRTKIALPQSQQELIKRVHALGKPVVMVVLNGSALALNWEKENIPAIVEAWYPGQAAGSAIADVLFGDYNPGGRLPVTFYQSESDLPAFEDYHLTQQTYRYFSGEALYPFGYGLSYSHFQYSDLLVPSKVNAGQPVTIQVQVTNDSKRDGDEVVQVYVSSKTWPKNAPIRQLAAFSRINVSAGAANKMTLELPAEAFSVINENGDRIYLPGEYRVSVGGGQPDQKVVPTSNILNAVVHMIR